MSLVGKTIIAKNQHFTVLDSPIVSYMTIPVTMYLAESHEDGSIKLISPTEVTLVEHNYREKTKG